MTPIERFVDLALQGQRKGCSGGERHARILALAVLDSINILDGSAREGLIEFIHSAAAAPETCRELVKAYKGI